MADCKPKETSHGVLLDPLERDGDRVDNNKAKNTQTISARNTLCLLGMGERKSLSAEYIKPVGVNLYD